MITNTGKNILSKYLVGQAPAYASYISFGCGAEAKLASSSFDQTDIDTYGAKDNMDFEMFRAPIISRGYVDDSGSTQLVLTAELPSEERYEITEVGVFSAASNPAAGANDSRILFSFTDSENWEYHTSTESKTIPFYQQNLSESALDEETGEYSLPEGGLEDSINITDPVFSANSDNTIFDDTIRVNRSERARFLNNTIFMRGDFSEIRGTGDGLYYDTDPLETDPLYNPNHIHLNGVSVNLEKASGKDELKIGYSVVNKDVALGESPPEPHSVSIIVEFASADTVVDTDKEYARFKIYNDSNNFSTNRYFVATTKLEDMEYSPNFSWNRVSVVKIYASAAESEVLSYSDELYVALDAIRYENVTSESPLYGMTGYTVVRNSDASGQYARPIIKEANTANLMEFRFALDVA